MSEEDPFFVVRDEVLTALNKARQLYERWLELQADSTGITKEEIEWTTTELRNGLRSIEWDLEDLEETVAIVEANPRKFKFDEHEISSRRRFITQTREEVQQMRDNVAESSKTSGQSKRTTVASLMNSGLNSVAAATNGNQTKYSKLSNEIDSPSHHSMASPYADTTVADVDLGMHQSLMMRGHNDDLSTLKNSIGTLKDMTRSIGQQQQRRDEHAVMLDELGGEVEVTTSRVDFAVKKVARVLGLSNDRRQWAAIGILSLILLALIVFLVV